MQNLSRKANLQFSASSKSDPGHQKSEVYEQAVMDMGSYEKLPNTEFSIEKLTILVDKYVFPEFDFRYVGKSGGVPRVVWKG